MSSRRCSRAVYKRDRPQLVIECMGGRNLGRCYNASYYKITSTKKLSKDKITGLYKLGMLGFGQEFNIKSQCDGEEEPAGMDVVLCIDEGTGEAAVNPYSGKLYGPHEDPYYVYKTEHRVDSGD